MTRSYTSEKQLAPLIAYNAARVAEPLCKRGHPLVRAFGQRICRECRKLASRAYRRRQKKARAARCARAFPHLKDSP